MASIFFMDMISAGTDTNNREAGVNRNLKKFLFLLAVTGAAAASDDVQDPANPYFIITERNVFHLNPIPPPPEPEKVKVDLPIVKISGFVKIGNSSKALFSSMPKDKKDKPTYYSLAEGEKQGFLELVKIYPDNDKVDIINSGEKMTLSIKEEESKDIASAGPGKGTPAANPTADPMRGGFYHGRGTPGLPGFPGMGNPGGHGGDNLPHFPQRQRRTP
jgi:hypothetical protein